MSENSESPSLVPAEEITPITVAQTKSFKMPFLEPVF